jgi:hypothetical protein
MEEYRQTNQLELHVNGEVRAELLRESLSQTLHSHLQSVYETCTAQCILTPTPLSQREVECMLSCYAKANQAHHAHLKALLI